MKLYLYLLLFFGLTIFAEPSQLSADKVQELQHLSASYKEEYSLLNSSINSLSYKFETLYKEQVLLNKTLLETNQKLEEKISIDKKEKIYTWLGIGGAALLGMLAN
jgi:hypothetical protein